MPTPFTWFKGWRGNGRPEQHPEAQADFTSHRPPGRMTRSGRAHVHTVPAQEIPLSEQAPPRRTQNVYIAGARPPRAGLPPEHPSALPVTQAAVPVTRSAPAPQPRPAAPERSPWLGPVVGKPIGDFEPHPPAPSSYRPDTVLDGWSSDDFTVRLGSVRGYGHRCTDDPRQDDVMATWHERTSAVVFAIADGVSSAKLSHIGSTLACREAVNVILDGLDAPEPRVDWQNLVDRAAWQLCEQIKARFQLSEVDRELTSQEMATTLVTGYVVPTPQGPYVYLIRVGDSSAWILRNGAFRNMFTGKYESADGLVDPATIALPRVPAVRALHGPLSPESVLLVGTDGFGDALGDGDNAVGRHFAERLAAPGPALKFARDLDFSRELFDDDRTLFALWPRHWS